MPAAVATLLIVVSSFPGFAGPQAAVLAMSTSLLIVLAVAATAVPAWRAVRFEGLDADEWFRR